MTTIGDLRSALLAAPRVLLDADDRRVLDDAVTSLDALEGLDVVPTVLSVVGSSGSGKSTIVNAIVGADVCEVGVVRPTTVRPVMIGVSGPVSLRVESDYVHLPTARPGVLVIDTPPWEHDPDAVLSVLEVSDAVVLVLTQSRYADAAVADLVGAIPDDRTRTTVLNRVAAPHDSRAALLAAASAMYGADLVVVEEHADLSETAEAMIGSLPIDTVGYERAAVLRSAAASSSRHVAGALTASANDIGKLLATVAALPEPDFSHAVFTVFDEWQATRAGLVQSVSRRIHDTDEEILERFDRGLASRLLEEIGRWEGEGAFAAELDRWREATVSDIAALARTRWRRRAAVEQIDRYAWRVAINDTSQIPQRMHRVLGGRLGEGATEARTHLIDLMRGAVVARKGEWRKRLADLAAYTPGVLLASADGFAPGTPHRG